MNTESISHLLASANDGFDKILKHHPEDKDLVNIAMANIKENNDEYFATRQDLPVNIRTPTTEELLEMRNWSINYKRDHKFHSERQMRKALQKHFNIRIF